jgi:hypothetical protein
MCRISRFPDAATVLAVHAVSAAYFSAYGEFGHFAFAPNPILDPAVDLKR